MRSLRMRRRSAFKSLVLSANALPKITRGDGDGQQVEIWAKAAGQDPQFFAFSRSMEAYRQALGALTPGAKGFQIFGNVTLMDLGGRNADDLVGSVEAFVHHLRGKQKLTLRTATMPLPAPVKPLTPSQVRSIRKKLNVSQPVFAAMMNIPTVTAASWERGRRKPTGAALRLLDIARKHPEVLVAG